MKSIIKSTRKSRFSQRTGKLYVSNGKIYYGGGYGKPMSKYFKPKKTGDKKIVVFNGGGYGAPNNIK